MCMAMELSVNLAEHRPFERFVDQKVSFALSGLAFGTFVLL